MVVERKVSERFKFSDGRDMNPFWIYKMMDQKEKYICCRLVRGGGPLGWNRRSINAAHIKMADVESLIENGIVKRTTLFQMAKDLIENPEAQEKKSDLDEEGGFFAIRESWNRVFYFQFDEAIDIVKNGEEAGSEERYQVARQDLYSFLEMLF